MKLINRRDFLGKGGGLVGLVLAMSPLVTSCGSKDASTQPSGERIFRETNGKIESKIDITRNLFTEKITDSYDPGLADLIAETYKAGHGTDIPDIGLTFLPREQFKSSFNVPDQIIGFAQGDELAIVNDLKYNQAIRIIFHEVGHVSSELREYYAVFSELKLSINMYTKTEFGLFDQTTEYRQLLIDIGRNPDTQIDSFWNSVVNPLVDASAALSIHRATSDIVGFFDQTRYNRARAVILSYLSEGKPLDEIGFTIQLSTVDQLITKANEFRALDEGLALIKVKAAFDNLYRLEIESSQIGLAGKTKIRGFYNLFSNVLA